VTVPGASGPIVQVAAGSNASFAITASGQLFAWGYNGYGALGIPTTTKETPTPMLVSFPFGTTIDTVAASARSSHTIAVTAELAVLTNTLPAGNVGAPYSASAAVAGGVGPYAWSATGLPAGLSINGSGQIAGTPTAGGTSSVVLHASDRFGISASSVTIPLTIVAPGSGAGPSTGSVTAAGLKASLLSQLKADGKAAKLAALTKRKSYSYAFTALTAGTLTISWYFVPRGAHVSATAKVKAKAKPVLLAAGKVLFKSAGKRTITIALTRRGIALLRHKRSVGISAKGSFTATGGKPVTAIKRLMLGQ